MTRATGVESSHLRVVPRTEEISRRWMVLDALNPPNMYTEVPIALEPIASIRSPLYPIRYLTRDIRIDDEECRRRVLPDRINLPMGKDLVLRRPVT
jgi:hypothetical protein